MRQALIIIAESIGRMAGGFVIGSLVGMFASMFVFVLGAALFGMAAASLAMNVTIIAGMYYCTAWALLRTDGIDSFLGFSE